MGPGWQDDKARARALSQQKLDDAFGLNSPIGNRTVNEGAVQRFGVR